MANREWWRGAVIYQIDPRGFSDGDGDGVGDLPGLLRRLPYIRALGVDAVWVGPFYASGGADGGYDVSDHRAVDARMGTQRDVDAVVERAHDLGLKVIVDQVWSHTSDTHPWFGQSRAGRDGTRADWFVWADAAADGGPPNGWRAVSGGPAWTWDAGRGQYYLHRLRAGAPSLNLRHPHVVEAMCEVAHAWLYRGVDGLRFGAVDCWLHDPSLRDDAAPADASALLGRVRGLLDAYPGVCGWGGIAARRGGRMSDFGGLHMVSPRPPASLEPAALRALLEEAAGAGAVGAGAESWPCWAFGGRDVARLASRLGRGDAAAARMAMALQMTLRGSACVDQGDELGLPEPAGSGGGRTPMPWVHDMPHAGFTRGTPVVAVADEHGPLAADVQEADPDSMLHAYRRFIRWRGAQRVLRVGGMRSLALQAPLIGFERFADGEHLLAVFNPTPEPAVCDLSDYESLALETDAGFDMSMSGSVACLPGYGAAFVYAVPARAWQEEAAVSFA